MVRRLALLQRENPDPNPETWYYSKYGEEPDYSNLLEALAKTPAERQKLLQEYWEPNDQDRKEGRKQPTRAHRAIATLVAEGYIRVILTTNFDHLMEEALRDEGIEPTVLSTPDQVENAVPLVHARCCVVKLHGDYLDSRIRNTSTELQSYSPEFNKLLDQVFDEFGLIVCGWSAQWDKALRDVFYRCQSHRFTTYWAVRGNPNAETRLLIDHRKAEMVKIESADTFFGTLQEDIEAVNRFSRPQQSMGEATVAILKQYISEPKYRIQYSDLFNDAVRKVVDNISGDDFSADVPRPDGESFAERLRKYDVACSSLLALAPVAAYWAEADHHSILERALARLAAIEERGGYTVWLSLKRYPSLLMLFALGVGAVEADRMDFLGRLFLAQIHEANEGDLPAVAILPRHCLAGDVVSLAKSLPNLERHYFPMSDWIYDTLRKYTREVVPSETRHELVFTKLEVLLALGFAHWEGGRFGYWAPPGTFAYRHEERGRILNEIEESLTRLQDESPFVKCGIFGDTADICKNGIAKLKAFLPKLRSF